MKKKTPHPRPRLAWAIVMRGGYIDEVGFQKNHMHPLDDEHLIRVLVSAAPAKKARKRA